MQACMVYETKNIRWLSLKELNKLLEHDKNMFYPMHVTTLEKYCKLKLEQVTIK